jgi:DNA-binding helix-turn-helix protein
LLKRLESKDILAINLKYYRYQRNLSQEKYAELLGSTLPYINQLENGKRKPTLELLDKFSDVLGVTSADLITYNKQHYIIAKRIDERK